MKKLSFLLTLLYISLFSYSQQKKEETPKVISNQNNSQANTPNANTKTNPATPAYINENDEYMGRKAEFLEVLATDKIPTDFPKYKKGMDIRGYNEVIDNYFRKYPEKLKELYRKKYEH